MALFEMRDREEFFRMLLSEERRVWQNPREILLRLGLKRGHRFLDVGSGPGFFAVEAASIVGEEGYVFCVDADSRAAELCAQNLAGVGHRSFRVLASRIEEADLPGAFFDVALIANVLHDFEDPASVLRKVFWALRSGGILGVVDWKKQETPFGPPLYVRLSLDECLALVAGAGFTLVETDESPPYHYLVVSRKQHC